MRMTITKTFKKSVEISHNDWVGAATTISKEIDPKNAEEFIAESDKVAEQARLTTERDFQRALPQGK